MARTASGEFVVERGDVRGPVASAAGRGVRGGVQRGEVRDGVCPATVHHGAFEVDGVRGAVYDAGATLEWRRRLRSRDGRAPVEEADEPTSIMPVGPTRRGGGSRPWFAGGGGGGSEAWPRSGSVRLRSRPSRGCCSPGRRRRGRWWGGCAVRRTRGPVGVWTLRFEARVVLRAPGDVVVGLPSLTPGPLACRRAYQRHGSGSRPSFWRERRDDRDSRETLTTTEAGSRCEGARR